MEIMSLYLSLGDKLRITSCLSIQYEFRENWLRSTGILLTGVKEFQSLFPTIIY